MVEIALGHIPNLKIDDRELIKNSPSFAYETLVDLKHDYSEDTLLWIMGTDSFLEIETWFAYESFINESHILILQRPNSTIEIDNPYKTRIKQKKQIVKMDFKDLSKSIYLLNINPIEITSTEIRKRIANNENISDLVHSDVNKLIQRNNLYLTNE